MSLQATLAIAATFLVPPPDDDSVVRLKDGKSIRCQVTQRKNDAIEVLAEGKKRRIPRAQLDCITDLEGHIRWQDRLVVSTAHYEIHANVPRERAQELGRKLELLYAWFFATFEKDWKLHHVKRLQVRCARTRAEYEQHLANLVPTRPAPLAFYTNGEEGLCMCDQPIPGGRSETVLFHEAGHQLLHMTANFLSAGDEPHYWVTEAIPCTFEGLVERDGKLVEEVNKNRFANLRARLQAGNGVHKLAALDAQTRGSFRVEEYDQACTLAWFLLKAEGGKYRKGFLKFVEDVQFSRVRPETFQKQVGRTLEELEAEWRAFVQSVPLGAPEK